MKKFIYTIFLSAIMSSHVLADTNLSEEKKVLIDRLLEQTGQSAAAVGTQFSGLFLQQMKPALQNANPNIDPKAFTILEEEVTSTIEKEVFGGAFSELMYPIYSKHFTADELRQMIEINDTEFGKKLISVMPLISQESIQAGQLLGQTLGPKIQQRIEARFEEEGIEF